ncbi:putative Porin [uncultured Gammaproteobacteria bacterium]
MKSYLLAGCAAAALAFGAGAAGAQTATGPGPGKFQVTLGGDAYFDAGFVSQDRDANQINGLRTVEFANRFRLVVTPKATADNGISYGARLRLRASTLGAEQRAIDSDQAYIFVSGNFGEVRAGEVEGPSHAINAYVNRPIDWQLQAQHDRYRDFLPAQGFDGNGTAVTPVTAANYNPNSGRAFGSSLVGAAQTSPSSSIVAAAGMGGVSATTPVVGAYTYGSGAQQFQTQQSADPATKLVYITPRFSGFQGAASYMPRTRDYNATATRTNRSAGMTGLTAAGAATLATGITSLVANDFQDVYEITANYTGEFSGVMLKAMAGYQGGAATRDARFVGDAGITNYNDLSSWQVGAQAGYAGVVVGGGYINSGKSGYTTAPFLGTAGKANAQTIPGGASPYRTMLEDQWGWNAGIQYTTGPIVVGFGYTHSEDAGNLIVPGARKLNQYTLGGKYTVAPGFTMGLEYTYFSADDDRPNGAGSFTNGGNTYGISQATNALGNTVNTNYDDSGSVVLLRTGLAF